MGYEGRRLEAKSSAQKNALLLLFATVKEWAMDTNTEGLVTIMDPAIELAQERLKGIQAGAQRPVINRRDGADHRSFAI